MVRILEKDGTEITNIDGAFINHYMAQRQSGILGGRFQDCLVQDGTDDNAVHIGAGHLLISGFNVVISEETTVELTEIAGPGSYHVKARITTNDDVPSFNFIISSADEDILEQDDLFIDETSNGSYEILIATVNIDGESGSYQVNGVEMELPL